MNRRNFITGLGASLTAMMAGCSSIGSTETKTATTKQYYTVNESEAPQYVRKAKDGAGAMLKACVEAGYDARVNISKGGGLIVSYSSNAEVGQQIKEELHEISRIYATIVSNHDGVGNMTIVANGIQAHVKRTPAVEYANGDLKENAYYKTIEMRTHGE